MYVLSVFRDVFWCVSVCLVVFKCILECVWRYSECVLGVL